MFQKIKEAHSMTVYVIKPNRKWLYSKKNRFIWLKYPMLFCISYFIVKLLEE